jgi:hypothetical protein
MDGSIVDYLNSQGQDSSYAARAALAAKNGISNYTGTAAQNTQLLQSLQGGASNNSQTFSGLNSNPNNLTPAQIAAGYSTIPGSFSPLTGQPNAASSNSGDPTGISKNPGAGETIMVGQYKVKGNSDGTATVTSPSGNTFELDANANLKANTGNSAVDTALDNAGSYLTQQIQAGNTLNPNLAITPALTQQFLAESQAQMDPQGQQNLTGEIDNINNALNQATETYNQNVASSNLNFQENLLAERNAAAGSVGDSSGARNLVEQQMQQGQNLSLAGLATNAQYNIGNILNSGGAAVGNGISGLNGNQSNFNLPNLYQGTASLSGLGGAGAPAQALNYNYNPGTYTLGSLNNSYQQAVAAQGNQYISSYLTSAGNNSPSAQANGGPSFSSLNGQTPTLNQ